MPEGEEEDETVEQEAFIEIQYLNDIDKSLVCFDKKSTKKIFFEYMCNKVITFGTHKDSTYQFQDERVSENHC